MFLLLLIVFVFVLSKTAHFLERSNDDFLNNYYLLYLEAVDVHWTNAWFAPYRSNDFKTRQTVWPIQYRILLTIINFKPIAIENQKRRKYKYKSSSVEPFKSTTTPRIASRQIRWVRAKSNVSPFKFFRHRFLTSERMNKVTWSKVESNASTKTYTSIWEAMYSLES